MKILKIIILFALLSQLIFAEGGSIYTRYGVGDILNTNSARRLGMGSLGISLPDQSYLNYLNPAAWSKLDLTRFEVGLDYQGNLTDDAIESKFYSNYHFSGFTFGFPIDKDYGISVAFGMVPLTNVNYEVAESKAEDESNPFSEVFNLDYKGNGGLSKIFIGMSYKLPFDFFVGASFDYYTGKTEYKSSIDFSDNSDFTDATFTKKFSYRGNGGTFGLISSDLSKMLAIDKVRNLRFGLMLNYFSKLDTDTSLTSSTSIGTINNDKDIIKTEIPFKLGFGMSFTWDENYLILIDYLYQPWSKFKSNGHKSYFLQDYSKASVGMEYGTRQTRFTDTFWEQLLLRGGLSYERTQYTFYGESINKFSVSLGVSMPLGLNNSIDIAFEYGIRGTNDSNLIKENLFNAAISFSFGELWFIRQER